MSKQKRPRAVKAQQKAAARTEPPGHRYFNNHDGSRYASPTPGCSSSSSSSPDASSPMLNDRFNALPYELRAEVFAQLLVTPQPNKWDAIHRSDCAIPGAPNPFMSLRPSLNQLTHTCASHFGPATSWRHRDKPVWVDPWRSAWAPPQLNPYLCTTCYDARWRPRPFPSGCGSSPCLCARRANLQVLLVCRRWYEEAGRVFYARNWFAFGRPAECVEFLETLNPRWKAIVSKVSLLALTPSEFIPISADEGLDEVELLVGGKAGLRRAWAELASLPGLSWLEIDAIYLTSPQCVKVFEGSSMKDLRRLDFVQASRTKDSDCARRFVWPFLANRTAVKSDLVIDVARGIKGL